VIVTESFEEMILFLRDPINDNYLIGPENVKYYR
jgi:hypothetical protein